MRTRTVSPCLLANVIDIDAIGCGLYHPIQNRNVTNPAASRPLKSRMSIARIVLIPESLGDKIVGLLTGRGLLIEEQGEAARPSDSRMIHRCSDGVGNVNVEILPCHEKPQVMFVIVVPFSLHPNGEPYSADIDVQEVVCDCLYRNGAYPPGTKAYLL